MSKQQPKKRSNLDPQAAKILEQYRNSKAGAPPGASDAAGPAGEGSGGAQKPSAPPPSAQMRRSGTRGK